MRELASQFLALAKKQKATGPLVMAHRLLATALLHQETLLRPERIYDQAMALYDPVEHRPLAIRFGQDVGVNLVLSVVGVVVLGYPEAALSDADHAVKDVRDISQAGSLMYALFRASFTHISVETMRRQRLSLMNLSLWRTKKELVLEGLSNERSRQVTVFNGEALRRTSTCSRQEVGYDGTGAPFY